MLRVGTSGWSYNHWEGLFYPQDLTTDRWLEFYAKNFDTVELNSSFYHLPKKKTFENWYQRTPNGFVFSVKGSRFISHILKLNSAREPLESLLDAASELKEKLGPILFQLPPNFTLDFERLEKFTKTLPKDQRFTFEFRHESWFCDKVYELLEKKNLALTISDTPKYPLVFETTADFIYVRLHGHEKLYASKYSKKELEDWVAKIKVWLAADLDVYIYFDNDANANAIQNAKELKKVFLDVGSVSRA